MIVFENVSKVYDAASSSDVVALKDINLKINDGEFVFFVGPSGAGKTTMMRLLTRMEAPTSGKLNVNGYDLVKIPNRKIPKYRSSIGVEFQDCKLFEKSTVYENIAFAMRVIGQPNKKIKVRVPKLLEAFDLVDRMDHFPRQISGGEAQRVALARALANNPKILIADEPTAGLDRKMSSEVMKLLVRLGSDGKRTIIVITHEQALVEQYNKRTVRFEGGMIVSDTGGGDVHESV